MSIQLSQEEIDLLSEVTESKNNTYINPQYNSVSYGNVDLSVDLVEPRYEAPKRKDYNKVCKYCQTKMTTQRCLKNNGHHSWTVYCSHCGYYLSI